MLFDVDVVVDVDVDVCLLFVCCLFVRIVSVVIDC
jgi:hypothetical protein